MDAITNRKKGGRPKKAAEETRNKSIHILCLISEHQELKRLAKSYGLTISEYVLKKAFDRRLVFNHVEFMQELHQIGTVLSRAGNNINQLAKHANSLNKIGRLNESIIDRLNIFLVDYNTNQDKIRIAFRKIIREMAKR